uniref:Uncharacterized protein n=1 Tax=Rhizophora mucronata TaxID=61149 RepID=A0A2P2QKI5_RHIMU
MNSKKKTK